MPTVDEVGLHMRRTRPKTTNVVEAIRVQFVCVLSKGRACPGGRTQPDIGLADSYWRTRMKPPQQLLTAQVDIVMPAAEWDSFCRALARRRDPSPRSRSCSPSLPVYRIGIIQSTRKAPWSPSESLHPRPSAAMGPAANRKTRGVLQAAESCSLGAHPQKNARPGGCEPKSCRSAPTCRGGACRSRATSARSAWRSCRRDPLFYGVARYLCDRLGKDQFEVLPHVSSMQLAFCPPSRILEEAYLTNLATHALEDVLDRCARPRRSECSPAKRRGPPQVAREAAGPGLDYFRAYVCENLGSPTNASRKPS